MQESVLTTDAALALFESIEEGTTKPNFLAKSTFSLVYS